MDGHINKCEICCQIWCTLSPVENKNKEKKIIKPILVQRIEHLEWKDKLVLNTSLITHTIKCHKFYL